MENYKASCRIMRKKRKQKTKGIQLKLPRYIITKLDKNYFAKNIRSHDSYERPYMLLSECYNLNKVLMMTLF